MGTSESHIYQYLRMMDSLRGPSIPAEYTYMSYEDYVLDRGSFETSRALSVEQTALVRAYSRTTRPKVKECYYNAQSLALFDPSRFVYREGWAIGSTIPVMHAWCVLDGACVIDLTWRQGKFGGRNYATTARRIRGVLPAGWEYLGVSYSVPEIKEQLRVNRAWCCFHDNWRQGHPLLKNPRLAPRETPISLGLCDILRETV